MVSINELSKSFISNYEDLIDFKEIEIKLEENADLKVKINVALAEILISNLIKNSIFHNVENGDINIKITKEEFMICNTGNPTALEDRKSTRLNSSHVRISYAVFCLKKKK